MQGRSSQGIAMAAVECDHQVGNSMLARRLTTLRPAMTLAEAMETTRIHRVAGRTGDRTALVTTRPCRPPSIPSRTRD
jgi:predicted ATPase with chaperone activity